MRSQFHHIRVPVLRTNGILGQYFSMMVILFTAISDTDSICIIGGTQLYNHHYDLPYSSSFAGVPERDPAD